MKLEINLSRGQKPAPSMGGNLIDTLQKNRIVEEKTKSLEKRIYNAAQVSRLTSDWFINITSANAEILVSRKAVISRHRQLERDDVYMRRALRLMENNIIGHNGIRLHPDVRTNATATGEAGDEEAPVDRKACRAVIKAWKRWSKPKNCTVTGNMSFRRCQNMTVRAWKRDGGILWRIRRGYQNDFHFAIEPIEIDRLDHDYNRPSLVDISKGYSNDKATNQIQFGVEMDTFNKPVAYHILFKHPGETFAYRPSPQYRERVPAEDIINIWTPERAGQFVGMPDAVAVVTLLNHLSRYSEAEVIAARVSACKGGFLVKKVPEDYTGQKDALGNTLQEIQPGFMETLPMGFEFQEFNPTHPNGQYWMFQKAILRGVASGFNLSYHTLANDLEGISFSSIRSGTLEDREEYCTGQEDIIEMLCDPTYEQWLPLALMSGQIEDHTFEDLDRLKEVLWKGRRWEWVDPLRDVQADDAAVKAGFTSRRRVVSDMTGEDPATIDLEQEEDQESEVAHGQNYNPLPIPGFGEGYPPDQNGNENPPKKPIVPNTKGHNGHVSRQSLVNDIEWNCDHCGDRGNVSHEDDLPAQCPVCHGEVSLQHEECRNSDTLKKPVARLNS